MQPIKLSNSWDKFLKDEFEKDYFQNLQKFILSERKKNKTIYPEEKNIFKALEQTPLENVKVVILGQDPYHGPQQAHGLSFSVPEKIKWPPSLRNIFKELSSDLNTPLPASGELLLWAQQGVLLLNSVLTVEEGKAASHQGQGWEIFTDKIIELINEHCDHVVFILWGAYAQKKAQFVQREKHLILECVHPSPLSAHRGFFGSKPFSKTNDWLIKNKKTPIKWNLS